MSDERAACLYRATVTHRRPGRPRYRFAYRTYHLAFDLDDIESVFAASRLISRNRFNLLSFHDADHGPHDGTSLRAWADGVLAEHGIDLGGGRIRLLAMPRVFGYGFNPISLYYCHHADGELRAVLAEVHNTFGEHHVYVLHDNGAPMPWGKTGAKHKRFHVSPFFDRRGFYRFHLLAPGARLGVGIRLFDDQGTLRIATALAGYQRALGTGEILRAALVVPLMSWKVTAAIHWQALKLWRRGAVFHRKPAPDPSNRS